MLVLVVVPDIGNPFFADVLLGIDDALSRDGYGLLIGNLGHGGGKERHLLQVVRAGQVDGVILLNGSVPSDGARSLSHADLPMVAICETIPGADFPQVDVTNRAAAAAAVAHLVELGHRRLAYLGGPPGNILEHARQSGFRDGLAHAGIAAESAAFYPGDFTFAGGAAAAAMSRGADRPTALFAANDEMAIGFLCAARAAGLRVPDDLSVMGFDGIGFADYVEPLLTTFRQPRRELGQVGAELLVRGMTGRPIALSERRISLPVELLARASTGPAPA